MKKVFLLLFLCFSLISGFSQKKHKWVNTKNPLPIDTSISFSHIYPEPDYEKNWNKLFIKIPRDTMYMVINPVTKDTSILKKHFVIDPCPNYPGYTNPKY
jgi:hypothetical protein